VKSNQRKTQEKLAATSCTINLQQPNSFSSVADMKPTDGFGRRKKHFSWNYASQFQQPKFLDIKIKTLQFKCKLTAKNIIYESA
jgi:hypothetical protein